MRLDILGPIEFFGVDHEVLIPQIRGAAPDEQIDLDINSPGGNFYQALGIATALASHSGPVVARVLGVAASAAAVLAVAGADRIEIASSASIMIHTAETMTYGNVSVHERALAGLKVADSGIADVFRARMGDVDVEALLEAETWYRGKEAVDVGLADAVMTRAVKTVQDYANSWGRFWKSQPPRDDGEEEAIAAGLRDLAATIRSEK